MAARARASPDEDPWQSFWRGGDGPTTPATAAGPVAPPPAPPRSGDDETLRALFASAPRRRAAPPAPRPRGDDWPEHNYNAAYETLAEQRRRIPALRHRPGPERLQIWELDEPSATPPARAEPAKPTAAAAARATARPDPPAWTKPADPAAMTPGAWLDRVARSGEPAQQSEAQLVRTLWGDPRRVAAPLFEATETLHARARTTRPTVHRAPLRRIEAGPPRRHARARLAVTALAGLALGLVAGALAMLLLAA